MKKHQQFALFAILLLVLPVTGQAQWHLVTHINYPPFNFEDAAGNPSGLDTELVIAVMDYLHQDYTITFVPWKRVVVMVETGQADLAFQFKSTRERRAKYLLVGPLRTGRTVFAAKETSAIPAYTDLNSLKPYTIGMNLGYSYGEAFDRADYLKKDDGAGTSEQLVQKLMLNRVDLIIGDRIILAWAARELDVHNQIKIIGTYNEFPRYVAVPKDKAHIAGWFQHGLNAIRENGTYDRIISKWK
ncbi:MAG: amino acid ABC transporter substrate-binding protein [Desulfobacter sp.]|nr:MAG: amino acid ABC transporter substrate-binding protein [Desulfobacter sp.]